MYSKVWTTTTVNLDYYTQQSHPLKLKEKEKSFFHDKNRLKEFMVSKPALHRLLEGKLQSKEKDKHTQEDTGNK